VVIHDAAYAALVFGRRAAQLSRHARREGRRRRAAFRQQDFQHDRLRCGFVAGNELLVKAYGDIKDNSDSGQFLAIQHAAAYALTIRKSRKRSPTNIRAE